MERAAQRVVIVGLVSVLTFAALVGLWAAAGPSPAVSVGVAHADLVASTVAPPLPVGTGVVAYLATFTETGLPAGALWFVNISGQSSLAATTSSVSTLLVNGSYSYMVASSTRGYSAVASSFAVTGTPVAVPIGFTTVTVPAAYTGPTGVPLSWTQVVAIVVGVAAASVVGVVVIRVSRTYRPTASLRPPAA